MEVYREYIEPPPHESFRLLKWDDSLAHVEVCLAGGQTIPFAGAGMHWHVHGAVELTFIKHGQGARFVGDHIGPIKAPELVLMGANLPHYWSGLDESSGISIQVDLESRETRSVFPELMQLDPLLQTATRGLLFDADTARLAGDRMQQMVPAGGLARLTMVLELFRELLELDRRRWHPLCEKPFAIGANALHSQAISKAIGLVVEHFREDLTIEDLCEAVKLSRATFCRHFKQYTGHTPIGFLNGVRIDQARRMLVETSIPVSEIAGLSGFNNLSHFNRLFLRRTGETPTKYREHHR